MLSGAVYMWVGAPLYFTTSTHVGGWRGVPAQIEAEEAEPTEERWSLQLRAEPGERCPKPEELEAA